MEASVHMISEACEPGAAVFGGEGVGKSTDLR